MKRRLFNPLAGLSAIFVFASVFGCTHSMLDVESMREVPYPPGERPSILWTADPRTQGWNGVHVTYFLLGSGGVDAEVRSTDQRRQFAARGECWYENDKHEKCDAYPNGRFLVVKFGEKKESYRFEHRAGIDRGVITVVEPSSSPSLPQE